MVTLNYQEQLLQATRYDANEANNLKNIVPKLKGIYGWFTKNEDEIVYIGSATGKNAGLYRRIINQHLNPIYLETREERHNKYEDRFQLQNPVYTKKGEIAVDKSVFRKAIARAMKLKAGNESVNYLKLNLNLSFVVLDNLSREKILRIEEDLINSFQPKYNTLGKS